jgi:hypothetical protein
MACLLATASATAQQVRVSVTPYEAIQSED